MTTTFIARGSYDGSKISELQMIADTAGGKKFDDATFTADKLKAVTATGTSTHTKNIVYVKDDAANSATAIGIEPFTDVELTAIKGGSRKRSPKKKTQKRGGKRQKGGKSRRV